MCGLYTVSAVEVVEGLVINFNLECPRFVE